MPSACYAADWWTLGSSRRSRLPPPTRPCAYRGELARALMVYDCDAHHFASLAKPSPLCPVVVVALALPFVTLACRTWTRERERETSHQSVRPVTPRPWEILLSPILLLPISTEPYTSSRPAHHFQHSIQEQELEVLHCWEQRCLPQRRRACNCAIAALVSFLA